MLLQRSAVSRKSLEQYQSRTFRRRRLQLPNPVVPLSFFVVEPFSKPYVGFAYMSVGVVYVDSFG